MRTISVVTLAVMLCGATLWYAQMNRRETSTAERGVITGNVVINGSTLGGDRTALLKHSLAMDGDLSLVAGADGTIALEGNLNVRPN